jgi:ligand-binding SRPBCC domain-containing protein
MKVYTLKRRQFLPLTVNEAWDFFSTPKNLSRITPETMGFRILYSSGGDKMYTGQLIRYLVMVMPLVSVHWLTEITHVNEPWYFVDEQRFGPYALWHHQHHFKEVPGGIEMTDEVNYAIPFGLIGQLANRLFVERRVNAIFDYRFAVLEDFFAKDKTNIRKSA